MLGLDEMNSEVFCPPARSGRSPTFPFATRVTESPFGRLAYFDEGEGEAVVFVHGLCGDFTHWEHVVARLRPGRRVVGLDLPGCGLSSPQPGYSVAACRDALLWLMDRLGLERANLAGHSLGGAVVARTALAAPDRVDRLMLVDASGFRRFSASVQVLARALLRPELIAPVLARFNEQMLGQCFAAENPYVRKFSRDQLDRSNRSVVEYARMFASLRHDILHVHLLEHVDRLRMPTLVIWGDKDRLLPVQDVAAWAGRLPRGQLEILYNCGHMPNIEAPEVTSRLMARFLEASLDSDENHEDTACRTARLGG